MRILVGVGSVGAAAAPLRLVRALSATAEQDTTVVTVTPRTRSHAILGSAYAATIHRDAHDVLLATRDDAAWLPIAMREVVDRSVPRGLRHAAADEHADLIVLGGRARLLPTLAERLASRGPFPVVRVPRQWSAAGVRRIGVVVEDGTGGARALRVAADLADACDARLGLLGAVAVAPSVELARQRHPDLLAPVFAHERARLDWALASVECDVPAYTALRVGTPAQITRDLARELDLLVAVAHPWLARTRALARRLARHAACPLVLVPPAVASADARQPRARSEGATDHDT